MKLFACTKYLYVVLFFKTWFYLQLYEAESDSKKNWLSSGYKLHYATANLQFF